MRQQYDTHHKAWVPWQRLLHVTLYCFLLCALLEKTAAKDYANLRCSVLDQITPENVKNLHVAFKAEHPQ